MQALLSVLEPMTRQAGIKEDFTPLGIVASGVLVLGKAG